MLERPQPGTIGGVISVGNGTVRTAVAIFCICKAARRSTQSGSRTRKGDKPGHLSHPQITSRRTLPRIQLQSQDPRSRDPPPWNPRSENPQSRGTFIGMRNTRTSSFRTSFLSSLRMLSMNRLRYRQGMRITVSPVSFSVTVNLDVLTHHHIRSNYMAA